MYHFIVILVTTDGALRIEQHTTVNSNARKLFSTNGNFVMNFLLELMQTNMYTKEIKL